MKKTVLLFALLGSISFSFAQSAKIGIIGGLNLSTLSYTSNGSTTTTSAKAGFHAGLFADFGLGALSIQPAILYSTKGGKEDQNQTTNSGGSTYTVRGTDDVTLNYIEVPVNVLYHIPVVVGKIFFGGGPYVGYGVSGKTNFSLTSTQTSGNSTSSFSSAGSGNVTYGSGSSDVKNPDFGAQVMGGISLKGGLLFSAGYSFGIANLENTSNEKSHNNGFKLSVGYSFL